jgi:hypothetical protein
MNAETRLPSEQRINAEDARRSQRIREGILKAGDELRAAHPWLEKYQNAIGMGIFLTCYAAILGTAWAYYVGAVAWYVVIPVAAFFMSLLHELEHDLIHSMYFRKNKFWHNFMMIGVWVLRPSTINPFVRRRIHIHHHKVSGTESDLEERGITNGVPWSLKRLLMTGDNMLAVILRPFETRNMMKAFIRDQANLTPDEKKKIVRENVNGYFPLGTLNYLIWHSFVVWHVSVFFAGLAGHALTVPAALEGLYAFVCFFAVTISAPNALRTFCLHFVSSNMHYYGDVEKGNIVQQCQIWTTPWAIPLHLFCFNFAGTHAFHHFVVRDPFYIRQWIAPRLYPLMRENGIRFNDFGTFKRANRMEEATA